MKLKNVLIFFLLCFSTLFLANKAPEGRLHLQNNILMEMPQIYADSIQEALLTVASQEDLATISFKPLLGGLSGSKLFEVCVKDKRYVLRLMDHTKALERRQSEVIAHKAAATSIPITF